MQCSNKSCYAETIGFAMHDEGLSEEEFLKLKEAEATFYHENGTV